MLSPLGSRSCHGWQAVRMLSKGAFSAAHPINKMLFKAILVIEGWGQTERVIGCLIVRPTCCHLPGKQGKPAWGKPNGVLQGFFPFPLLSYFRLVRMADFALSLAASVILLRIAADTFGSVADLMASEYRMIPSRMSLPLNST